MPLIPSPAPDYATGDFASIRARLVSLCSSVFPNLDLDNLAELATLLLEVNAWVGDLLYYYLRNVGREARITTATQRRGLLGLVKLIGYRVPGATAARAVETFTVTAAQSGTVTFPEGTVVGTRSVASPILYQLLTDLVVSVSPGANTVTATVENSTFQEDVFNSTGAANQQVLLTQSPYIDASLRVTDAVTGPYDAAHNPGGWREVQNFLASANTDHVYTTSVDNLDRCLVTFGNGVTGAVPAGAVTYDYKTGGGAGGTVARGALVVLPGTWTDAVGNLVQVAVTNADAASPGTDRHSVAQIRQLAPASLTVQGRTVANADFETVANNTPGVLRSLSLTATEDSSVEWNSGALFIVPVGGGQPSSTLLKDVRAQFEQVPGYPPPPFPKLNAFPVGVYGVQYLTVTVSALLYLRPGAVPATVGAAVRAALTHFMSPTLPDGSVNPSVDFGYRFQDEAGKPTGAFAWSDLFDLVADIAGVLKVDPGPGGFLLNDARADVTLGNRQFPVLGHVALVNAVTGVAF